MYCKGYDTSFSSVFMAISTHTQPYLNALLSCFWLGSTVAILLLKAVEQNSSCTLELLFSLKKLQFAAVSHDIRMLIAFECVFVQFVGVIG